MALIGSLGEIDLGALDASISDTAGTIFVYDTRKDSDGGAWRKRTQHTSWYNETLNTAIRGSRREFPAVAVIVGRSGGLAIYDGDDPDMPMWMDCTVNTSVFWEGTISGISALNGKIAVACYPYDLNIVDMIKDSSTEYNNTGNSTRGPLSKRNGGATTWYYGSQAILARGVTDVTLTLLPNSKTDPDSNILIPTVIASCRSGYGGSNGVSIIRDDGTFSNITNNIYGSGYWDTPSVFDKKYIVTTASGDFTRVGIANIETGTHQFFITSPNIPGNYKINLGWATLTSPLKEGFALGGTYGSNQYRDPGVSLVQPNIDNPPNSMHVHINSKYNSGYQVGDIKGAFLSDTDATNVTGTELVTNGTFDTDSDWTKGTGWTISGGTAVATTITNGYLTSTNFSQTSGKTYVVSADITRTQGTCTPYWYDGSFTSMGSFEANGKLFYTYTASTTTSSASIRIYGSSSFSGTVDNVSVRIADPDRSVNNKGLQVFGTVTKSAVATGAELVAYSGWNNSNYLLQPYNTDFNWGTNTWSLSFWINPNSGTGPLIGHGDDSNDGFLVDIHYTSGTYYVDSGYLGNANGFARNNSNNGGALTNNSWNHVVIIDRDQRFYIYVNGVLHNFNWDHGAADWTTRWTNPITRIGGRTSNYPNFDQSGSGNIKVALVRFSQSEPSPEQIKKMYEDEKFLFQENAACTLYGSSDGPSSLAYDDSTNLLYVGTSSGRSDFQGLCRINNTTTAVTTAISASNGLVAEQ